jgi:hypothetical protein
MASHAGLQPPHRSTVELNDQAPVETTARSFQLTAQIHHAETNRRMPGFDPDMRQLMTAGARLIVNLRGTWRGDPDRLCDAAKEVMTPLAGPLEWRENLWCPGLTMSLSFFGRADKAIE